MHDIAQFHNTLGARRLLVSVLVSVLAPVLVSTLDSVLVSVTVTRGSGLAEQLLLEGHSWKSTGMLWKL